MKLIGGKIFSHFHVKMVFYQKVIHPENLLKNLCYVPNFSFRASIRSLRENKIPLPPIFQSGFRGDFWVYFTHGGSLKISIF